VVERPAELIAYARLRVLPHAAAAARVILEIVHPRLTHQLAAPGSRHALKKLRDGVFSVAAQRG
jgi:hypothetical protein